MGYTIYKQVVGLMASASFKYIYIDYLIKANFSKYYISSPDSWVYRLDNWMLLQNYSSFWLLPRLLVDLDYVHRPLLVVLHILALQPHTMSVNICMLINQPKILLKIIQIIFDLHLRTRWKIIVHQYILRSLAALARGYFLPLPASCKRRIQFQVPLRRQDFHPMFWNQNSWSARNN